MNKMFLLLLKPNLAVRRQLQSKPSAGHKKICLGQIFMIFFKQLNVYFNFSNKVRVLPLVLPLIKLPKFNLYSHSFLNSSASLCVPCSHLLLCCMPSSNRATFAKSILCLSCERCPFLRLPFTQFFNFPPPSPPFFLHLFNNPSSYILCPVKDKSF